MPIKKETKQKQTDSAEKSAAQYLPKDSHASLGELKKAAQKCQGCSLYLHATQTVFGAGSSSAKIMFVGEQPGDKEDLQGEPFVGPAGKLLERAIESAGIDKKNTYFTNAVKHFKFEERGKRRLHKKPKAVEIDACHPWLKAEIIKLKPDVIVCLGVTAARAVLGKTINISDYRGQLLASDLCARVLLTAHPSSILRMISSEDRHKGLSLLIKDLKTIHES